MFLLFITAFLRVIMIYSLFMEGNRTARLLTCLSERKKTWLEYLYYLWHIFYIVAEKPPCYALVWLFIIHLLQTYGWLLKRNWKNSLQQKWENSPKASSLKSTIHKKSQLNYQPKKPSNLKFQTQKRSFCSPSLLQLSTPWVTPINLSASLNHLDLFLKKVLIGIFRPLISISIWSWVRLRRQLQLLK